jgi:hypothetical protein
MAEQQVNSIPPTQAERSAGGAQPTQAEPSGVEASLESTTPEALVPSEVQGAASRVGEFMKKPPIGASVTGAVVLGAAVAFGVVEAAVAAGAAYAAYRLLKKRPSREGRTS